MTEGHSRAWRVAGGCVASHVWDLMTRFPSSTETGFVGRSPLRRLQSHRMTQARNFWAATGQAGAASSYLLTPVSVSCASLAPGEAVHCSCRRRKREPGS